MIAQWIRRRKYGIVKWIIVTLLGALTGLSYYLRSAGESWIILGISLAIAIGFLPSGIPEKLVRWQQKKNSRKDAQSALEQLRNTQQRYIKSLDAIIVSAMNFDAVLKVPYVAADGEVAASSYNGFCGGSGANTAYILSKLGAKVAVCGAVGRREIGDKLVGELSDAGVDTSLVFRGSKDSGRTIVLSSNGQRFIAVSAGANDELPTLLKGSALGKLKDYSLQSKIVHISSFVNPLAMMPAIHSLLEVMPQQAIVSYVPGDLQSSLGLDNVYNEKILRRATFLFIYANHFLKLIRESSQNEFTTINDSNIETFLLWRTRKGSVHPIIICVKEPILRKNMTVNPNYLSLYLCTDRILEVVRTSDFSPTTELIEDPTGAGDAAAAGALIEVLRQPEELTLKGIAEEALRVSLAVASKLGPRAGVDSLQSK